MVILDEADEMTTDAQNALRRGEDKLFSPEIDFPIDKHPAL